MPIIPARAQPQPVATFLQFLCEKLMGPSLSDRGDGQSEWPCPRCGCERWHTRPKEKGFRDRFSCWRCAWWGDEHDLLRHFWPRETYQDRMRRLAEWSKEYAAATSPPSSPGSGTGKGAGRIGPRPMANLSDATSVELAFRSLSGEEILTLAKAVTLARERGVDLESLGYFCWHAVGEEIERREEQAKRQRKQHPRPLRSPSRNGRGSSH